MSGFNDRKAVDELYESGKNEQDETDNQQFAQGPEEVGNVSNNMLHCHIIHHPSYQCWHCFSWYLLEC